MTGRGRSQRGTALVEVTWLSLLLLVPLLYVVLAVFEVQRASFGVASAARAAGRAYATAPTEEVGRERAELAARVAMQDQGVEAEQLELRITCRPEPGNCLAPGAVIEVGLNYPAVLPLMPSVLNDDRPSIKVSTTHRVPYGRFREDR